MHIESKSEKINRQKAMTKLSGEGRKYFNFIEFDDREELVAEIRKHPFGLFIILLTGALVASAMLAIGVFGAFLDLDSILQSNGLNEFNIFIVIISIILSIGVMIATYIAVFLHKSNVIYLTNEKIAQVLYRSLFDRKISQLSIGDIQDVTVKQKGVFAHLFNFGTLIIETAGEQENYNFNYVPEPYQVSKLIINTFEKNRSKYGN